jgi:two-component system, OmpR family, response regulator
MTDQPAMKPTLLLVEDDPRLASLVREFLLQHDFNVTVESWGDRAVQVILTTHPDLVILDVMLPGMNGMDVCRAVRSQYTGPIIMLTARDDDIDQIVGLEIGADDYIIKPAEPRVLLARIRALLRRRRFGATAGGDEEARMLQFGQLHIDRAARRVLLQGEAIALSTSEFDLLWLLASGAGNPLDRRFILSSLRNLDYDGVDRSIDIAISRLRKKLKDDAEPPEKIKTVRGKGYLFVADAWQ